MTLESAEKIADLLDQRSIDNEVYPDYSGRGMYGSTTAGVVTRDAGDVTWAMGRLGIVDDRRTDSMALDTIVY